MSGVRTAAHSVMVDSEGLWVMLCLNSPENQGSKPLFSEAAAAPPGICSANCVTFLKPQVKGFL